MPIFLHSFRIEHRLVPGQDKPTQFFFSRFLHFSKLFVDLFWPALNWRNRDARRVHTRSRCTPSCSRSVTAVEVYWARHRKERTNISRILTWVYFRAAFSEVFETLFTQSVANLSAAVGLANIETKCHKNSQGMAAYAVPRFSFRVQFFNGFMGSKNVPCHFMMFSLSLFLSSSAQSIPEIKIHQLGLFSLVYLKREERTNVENPYRIKSRAHFTFDLRWIRVNRNK